MASRTPCRYFQQGRCNRGSNCKFAHIYTNGNNGTAQGNTSSMSEAELLKSFINPSSLPKIERTIKNDMKDAESFRLSPLTSAYSYGAPCVVNLISGRDYSPEESRLEYYQARRQDTLPRYETQINSRESDMKECMNFTKVHTDWAARYLQVNTKQLVETGKRSIGNAFISFPLNLTGSRNARNTYGLFGGTVKQPAFSSSGFGQPPFSSGFGTPPFESSSFGSGSSSRSPFSTSTFGNIAAGNNQLTFGKPNFGSSTFGSTEHEPVLQQSSSGSNSVFGQPSFGSQANSNSAFGQPSFGSQANSNSAFGQPSFGSQANSNSAFGQPSFGSQANSNSAFGQPSFGSQANSGPAFGTSPFKIGNNEGNSSTFNVTRNQITNNAFDTARTQTSAFGQSSFKPSSTGDSKNVVQNSSTFGTSALKQNKYLTASSPFGSAASNGSPFASLKHNQDQPSPFIQSRSQISNAPFENDSQSAKSFGFGLEPKSAPFSNVTDSSIPQHMAFNFIQGLPTEEDRLSIKELDQETLQEFKMDHFNLGEVPDIPPPLEVGLR